MSFGVLFDTTLCIGCEACMDACHEKQGQPDTENYKLSALNYTVVKNKTINDEDIYFRQMCMHCDEPTCVSVCPVGAFKKTKEGAVIYDKDKCMGCRYCIMACPFDVPKYEWNKKIPYVKKCDMCYDRIKAGKKPACVEACPTEAAIFGKKEELVEIARERIKNNPETYHPYIYGIREAGGTSVLFISSVDMAALGFKKDGLNKAFPKFTWEVMKEIPNVATFGGVFLYGLWWIINRRVEVQKVELMESEQERRS